MSHVINVIRDMQGPPAPPVESHEPDTLLIGCIDARLDPQKDIGIPVGNALIHRTIAAIVPERKSDNLSETQDLIKTLEYAVGTKKVKHIVIMGHTSCGGLEECMSESHRSALPEVHRHLATIKPERDDIKNHHGGIDEIEEASVRKSLNNLLTYPGIQEKINAGELTVDGWVIDTHTHTIREYDATTEQFRNMGHTPQNEELNDTLSHVRGFKRQAPTHEDSSIHQPNILVFADLDARINPANNLRIPYGKALIYRDFIDPDSTHSAGKEAALEFALKAKGVKDIIVMGHTSDDAHPMLDPQQLIRDRIAKLQTYKTLENFKGVTIHGWLIDAKTHLVSGLNMDTGIFHPLKTTM
jgi:carbonic anhydrase